MEWYPVDTAPRDGTKFLGFWPCYGSANPRIGHYNPLKKRWYYGKSSSPKPSHWMPLPNPPEVKG